MVRVFFAVSGRLAVFAACHLNLHLDFRCVFQCNLKQVHGTGMADAVELAHRLGADADILHLLNQHQGGVVHLHHILGRQGSAVPALPLADKDSLSLHLGRDAAGILRGLFCAGFANRQFLVGSRLLLGGADRQLTASAHRQGNGQGNCCNLCSVHSMIPLWILKNIASYPSIIPFSPRILQGKDDTF